MRKQSIVIAGGFAALLVTGCATSGSVDKLNDRVSALEQRLGDAERRAAAAESSAQQAATDARTAQQNADRADAMFKKSVQK